MQVPIALTCWRPSVGAGRSVTDTQFVDAGAHRGLVALEDPCEGAHVLCADRYEAAIEVPPLDLYLPDVLPDHFTLGRLEALEAGQVDRDRTRGAAATRLSPVVGLRRHFGEQLVDRYPVEVCQALEAKD